MYMKKYIFLAASALALASCQSDDFLGNTPGNTPSSANSAIKFDGNAGKISRATQNTGTPAEMLDGQFKIYGVKKTSETQLISVFPDYYVWDVAAKNTTSNTNGWEYVGDKDGNTLGTGSITLIKNQTIKYWDYSASEYHFVAGSLIDAFDFGVKPGEDIKAATVSKLAGHINANAKGTALETNPVYIAAPVKVEKEAYQKPVTFTFIRQQSMVRVGIYETIPGYFIHDMKFYDADGKTATSSNIILTSSTEDYFVGGSNLKGTVNYNWTPNPSYTYTYDETGLTKSKNWYAGKLEESTPLATKSSEPTVATLYGTDTDMSKTGYFTVLPTPSTTKASAILIKCDYTLVADDGSGETIKVTGATAAIPEAYSKWEPNTRYTYLFKISENTNGTTGDPNNPKDPAGLYPITFNAVVAETTEKTEGTTTTFTAPSITTYQEGSVDENSGIKYAVNKPITVKVTNSVKGTDYDLNKTADSDGYVAVYKLSQPRTEADLQLDNIKGSELISGNSRDVTLGTDNKSFTFIPNEAGYYAIQYLTQTTTEGKTSNVYTYKVVYVEAATK